MLREVGKRDEELLVGFLQQHAGEMPRTMLRYAVERLDAPLRAGVALIVLALRVQRLRRREGRRVA
jgi:hypothetical protein